VRLPSKLIDRELRTRRHLSPALQLFHRRVLCKR